MLLAVEGGGLFSASASGYSKGLTLLLVGHNNEDRHMRVSPWNHYQLVDEESKSELPLASKKNRLPRGCTSCICFSRASAGLESPSPLKVGPAQQQDVSSGRLVSNKGKDSAHLDDESNGRKIGVKSSLKKRHSKVQVPVSVTNEHETAGGQGSNATSLIERRKVQWTDVCGNELTEIREFEPSETDGSEDEFENGNEKSCSCAIM